MPCATACWEGSKSLHTPECIMSVPERCGKEPLPWRPGPFSFRDPRLFRLFPPPEMGEGRVGVKAGGVPQAMLLPPSQPSPARGEGVEGSEKCGKNRELNGTAGDLHAERVYRIVC